MRLGTRPHNNERRVLPGRRSNHSGWPIEPSGAAWHEDARVEHCR